MVYDELAQAPNRQLFDVLKTSGGARSEPLLIVISTQSNDPNSVMQELVDYGRKVQQGTIEDPRFYSVIYEAPMDLDPWKESTWRLCNPGMPHIRSLSEMRSSAQQAQAIPSRENAFRNLYLNQPVDPLPTFLPVSEWKKCGQPVSTDLAGKTCFGGLDLADVRDLNSLALFFPDTGDVLSFTWIAELAIRESAQRDKVPYDLWSEDGYVEVTPGRAVDKRFIALKIKELSYLYDLVLVGYDPYGITEMQRLFEEEAVITDLFKFSQRFDSFTPAISALESLIMDKKIRHGNHPVLEWAFSNLVVDYDAAGHRKFTKAKARLKIDPMIALTMAIGTARALSLIHI